MSSGSKLLGFASMAALVAGLTIPALAQSQPGSPPNTMPVPNSGTQVKCNANGTATVTSGPNAETSTANNVPGTPVTSNNPSGSGTTTTQTPSVTKPSSAANVQCPKTTPAMPATPVQQNTAPAMPQNSSTNMDALNNNPNGSNWLEKFNRPMVSKSSMKTKKHHKRASGGGGY
jgi:hypothetical protein